MQELLVAEQPKEETKTETVGADAASPVSIPDLPGGSSKIETSTEDMLLEAKTNLQATGENDRVIDTPTPEPMSTIAQLQKFLDKRKKIQKQDLSTVPSSPYANNPDGEKPTLKADYLLPSVDIYSLSPEELRSKLDSAKGIGKKLAERIATTIEDIKEAVSGYTPEERNVLYSLNTAADLMSLEGVGMKRANAIAEALGMEVAIKVEPFYPELDDALGEDPGGFDEEPGAVSSTNVVSEITTPPKEGENLWGATLPAPSEADPSDWDDRSPEADLKFNHLPDYVADGVGEITVRKGMIDMDALLRKLQEKSGQTIPNTDNKNRVAPEQRQQEQPNETPIPSIVDLQPGQYTIGEGTVIQQPENGTTTNETPEEKSRLNKFFDALSKTRLSEGKQKVLRTVAQFALVASLTFTALTAGSMVQNRVDQAKQFIDKVSTLIMNMDIPDLKAEASSGVGGFIQNSQSANESIAMGQSVGADVVRDSVDETPSGPAQEITREQKADAALSAVGGAPPITIDAPSIAPNEATAFNAPPLAPVGFTIVPNAETAYQAPESLTTDQIIAAAEKAGIQDAPALEPAAPSVQSDVVSTPVIPYADGLPAFTQGPPTPNDEAKHVTYARDNNYMDAKLPPASTAEPQTEEARLFMPTLAQRLEKRPTDEIVKSGILETGMLATEITKNISEWIKLEAQNGRELPNDPAAGNAIMRLYMSLNPEVEWTALPPQPAIKEVTTIEEIAEHQGEEILVMKVPADLKLYRALLKPDDVGDPVLASILTRMKSGEIDAQNITPEEFERVFKFANGSGQPTQ